MSEAGIAPRRPLESKYARRKVESPVGAGAGSQPSCGRRGRLSVRRTVPLSSLDDWLGPACYHSFTAPVYYDLPETSRQKALGCLRIERNRPYRASRTWSGNFAGGCVRSAKRHPQFVRSGGETKIYEIPSASGTLSFLLAVYGNTRGCENSRRKRVTDA